MPNEKATAVREWDDARLDNEINEAYRALFTLRFQQATRQLQNYRALRDASGRSQAPNDQARTPDRAAR